MVDTQNRVGPAVINAAMAALKALFGSFTSLAVCYFCEPHIWLLLCSSCRAGQNSLYSAEIQTLMRRKFLRLGRVASCVNLQNLKWPKTFCGATVLALKLAKKKFDDVSLPDRFDIGRIEFERKFVPGLGVAVRRAIFAYKDFECSCEDLRYRTCLLGIDVYKVSELIVNEQSGKLTLTASEHAALCERLARPSPRESNQAAHLEVMSRSGPFYQFREHEIHRLQAEQREALWAYRRVKQILAQRAPTHKSKTCVQSPRAEELPDDCPPDQLITMVDKFPPYDGRLEMGSSGELEEQETVINVLEASGLQHWEWEVSPMLSWELLHMGISDSSGNWCSMVVNGPVVLVTRMKFPNPPMKM